MTGEVKEDELTGSGLQALSRKMDFLSSLDDNELSARLDVPVTSVRLFRFREDSPDSSSPVSIVNDVNSTASVNNSCFEIQSGDRQVFAITTQDEGGNWALCIQDSVSDSILKRTGNPTKSDVGERDAVYGNLQDNNLVIELKPIPRNVEDIEAESYRRLRVAAKGKGSTVKVRNLPVQMVRQSLGLPLKEKLYGTCYPSLTPDELDRVTTSEVIT